MKLSFTCILLFAYHVIVQSADSADSSMRIEDLDEDKKASDSTSQNMTATATSTPSTPKYLLLTDKGDTRDTNTQPASRQSTQPNPWHSLGCLCDSNAILGRHTYVPRNIVIPGVIPRGSALHRLTNPINCHRLTNPINCLSLENREKPPIALRRNIRKSNQREKKKERKKTARKFAGVLLMLADKFGESLTLSETPQPEAQTNVNMVRPSANGRSVQRSNFDVLDAQVNLRFSNMGISK